MQKMLSHPQSQNLPRLALSARAEILQGNLRVDYRIEGDIAAIKLPTAHPVFPAAPMSGHHADNMQYLDDLQKIHTDMAQQGERGRTDKLWEATCFEAFVRVHGEASYTEFNFAPSGQWAAYRFSAYRDGMTLLEGNQSVSTSFSYNDSLLELSASASLPPDLQGPLDIGLTAVIECNDGTKSYWSLAHGDGPPDFHHASCFALKI